MTDPTHPALGPALRDVRAVVFDTDGVITDSARVHAAAWRTAFDACLRAHPPEDPEQGRPFDLRDDCLRHVDGKPLLQSPAGGTLIAALDGAAAFLASRDLDTSGGSGRAVAADKERHFTERLRAHGVEAYPGTVRLVRALREAGVPVAAASASRHAGELLTRAGVRDVFDALVDGRGAFALVAGVDRAAGADTGAGLPRHGADIVVRDLGELLVEGVPR
ncbi:HAD family hydrolase [Streptomyces blattellae]|uniref:HAD family hydrolase n=1 Tax=Streptomyces blattellae TaxID=2569855 RepID=UPI0012B6CC0F|nr:HAD family hydrolase [Streptomyces blattellae]